MTDRLKQFDAAMGERSVTAERGSVYGPPSIDFSRAARLKAVIAECSDPLARHALEMIAVKIARLINTPYHLDSWVDIAGYARCGVAVTEPEEISEKPKAGSLVELCTACEIPIRCAEHKWCRKHDWPLRGTP